MNNSEIRIFIRENLVRLLEEDTKFHEGDKVIVIKTGDEGTITLSKHPFYAVQLEKTGVTTSYDFNDLTKDTSPSENNDFYGKYDVTPEPETPLQESIHNLLKECFLPPQVEIFLNNEPNFISFIKKDPLVIKTGYFGFSKIKDLKTIKDFAQEIAYYAGTCWEFGPDDFNKENLSKVIDDYMQDKYGPITKETGEKLKNIINKSSIIDLLKGKQQRFIDIEYENYLKQNKKENGDKWLKANNYKYSGNKNTKKLQESKPDQIIKLEGLLVIKEHETLSDILSDIRSIIGITIVRTEDIPDDTKKSKLFIKIDPFPFSELSEQEIKDGIKIKIRQIPGVKEFWTQHNSPSQNAVSELKFRIKENKFPKTKRSLIESRIEKQNIKLSESDSICNTDTELFQELADPRSSYPYEENIPNHWNFEDKYSNKLEVSFDPSSKYIESYFLLKNKEGDWIKAYDYDKVKWNIAPEYQLSGGSDEHRSDTVCAIILNEIIPKYLLNKKPSLVKLHPLNDYRYKVFLKCAEVCKTKYPEIQIKEMGPEIVLINK